MEYRGCKIEKFYSKEPVPKHIIREYYQSEKTRIDREITLKENKKKALDNGFIEESVDDAIDSFLSLIGEGN